jgi:hypothetical protein
MRAELVLMGKRIDMAPRARRRGLVIAVYGVLAIIIVLLWYFTHLRGTGVYVFWAAMLACRYFLGGYYRGGLVRPFQYRAPRNQDMPPPLLALKLRIYQPVLQTDDNEFKNDERELHQRDHAHYLAYQAVGMAVVLMGFVASLRVISPGLVPTFIAPDQFYYGFSLITLALFLTLPQVILLWTEPDMEAEFAERR